jgi:hypothetical protein
MCGLQVAGGEYLTNGETISGEVVVAESVSLVGVVMESKPPTAVGWLRALGDDGEFGVRAPGGVEVDGDLLLQRREGGRDIRVGQHGALVDDGDLDSGGVRDRLAAYGLSPGKKIWRTHSFKVACLWEEKLIR